MLELCVIRAAYSMQFIRFAGMILSVDMEIEV